MTLQIRCFALPVKYILEIIRKLLRIVDLATLSADRVRLKKVYQATSTLARFAIGPAIATTFRTHARVQDERICVRARAIDTGVFRLLCFWHLFNSHKGC